MSFLKEIRKRLGIEDENQPLIEKVKKAEIGSELVGLGPVPPFSSMAEKAKAEIDTGIAAYRDLDDAPVMTREKFKKTVGLARRGGKEAQQLLNKLRLDNVLDLDPDTVYDHYFKQKK